MDLINSITSNDIILSPLATITSVTTSNNGKSYSIATKLNLSQYSVTVNKTGYNFSSVSFELKDMATPTVSTPVISSSSTINANVSNPSVIVNLKDDAFTDEALKVENWTFDSKTSGLNKISSISKNSSTQVTITFDGTSSENGEFTISTMSKSFKSNISSNVITFKIVKLD